MSKLPELLGSLQAEETALARSLRAVADKHADEPEVFHTCGTLAGLSDQHAAKLSATTAGMAQATAVPVLAPREGGFGALLDVQDLYAMASHVQSSWTLVSQCAQALRDSELAALADACSTETQRQLSWLTTHLKAAATQAVLVAS